MKRTGRSRDVECVVFATRKLNGIMGGMERQLLLIATYLVQRGIRVIVYSLDKEVSQIFYQVDQRIDFRPLGNRESDTRASLKDRVFRQFVVFRSLKIDSPDAVVSFSTGALWYIAIPARLLQKKLILSERTGPSVYFITRAQKFRNFIFLGMRVCTRVVVQMPAYVKRYPKYLQSRLVVIPNEVPSFPLKALSNNSTVLRFGHVGRFCHQKQTLELVKSFCEFNRHRSTSKLLLIGSGDLNDEIEALIDEASMHKVIEVHPPTSDIASKLGLFDVLIHPSLWEGFPNSVAEALSAGIPVAGFEDCEGFRDLIHDGINGWIGKRNHPVNSITELLERVFDQRARVPNMARAARDSVSDFRKDKVVAKWIELLDLKQ